MRRKSFGSTSFARVALKLSGERVKRQNIFLTRAPVQRSLPARGTGMYRVSLTESCFPAVRDEAVEKIAIGDLLRRRAEAHADTVALKEVGYDGAIGRTWTYAELLS